MSGSRCEFSKFFSLTSFKMGYTPPSLFLFALRDSRPSQSRKATALRKKGGKSGTSQRVVIGQCMLWRRSLRSTKKALNGRGLLSGKQARCLSFALACG